MRGIWVVQDSHLRPPACKHGSHEKPTPKTYVRNATTVTEGALNGSRVIASAAGTCRRTGQVWWWVQNWAHSQPSGQ
jgi:hypothetical protein